MNSLSRLLFLGFAALFLSAGTVHADYKVSCVEDGKIVFSKTFKGETTEKAMERIHQRYEDALCLALDAESPGKNTGHTGAAGALKKAWGGEVLDQDLQSALAIISAGGQESVDQVSANVVPVSQTLGESGVSLVIGVYDGVDMVTAVEHWKLAANSSQYLALFEPEFKTVEDAITVTLHDVPDVIVGHVCEDAEKNGYKCSAAF